MKPQFDFSPELSSDLEWLLQNGKTGRAELASFLASEYYSDAVRLSWAILGDLEQARQSVEQAFTAALVNQYRFRFGLNARTWLFRFVIQAAGKMVRTPVGSGDMKSVSQPAPGDSLNDFLRSLDEREQWAIYVSVLLGWEAAETAELTGVDAGRVERLAGRFRQEAWRPSPESQAAQAAPALERALIERFPRLPLSEGERLAFSARLENAAEKQVAHNMKIVRLRETFIMAVGVALVAGLIFWFNQTLPDVSPSSGASAPTPRLIRVTRVVMVPVTATAGSTASLLTNYTVQPGDSLDSIAHLFGMAVADLMRLNGLSADAVLHVGQSLNVITTPHIRLRGAQVAKELPVAPLPLNASSTPREVIQRLTSSQSLWSTVWIDAQLTLNGPSGYIGPPDVTYEQAWVDNPGKRSTELSGKTPSRPDWVYTLSDNTSFHLDRQTGQSQAILSNQLITNDNLRAMLFPLNSDWLSSVENLVIGQVTPYSGRETLQVSVMNASGYLQAQLWIDVETGVILRELRYSGDRAEIQTADFSITNISFNSNFPESIFNPPNRLASGFSAEASGRVRKSVNNLKPPENSQAHQSFAAGLAPGGFDPAPARLYFRFPASFDTGAASEVVDVLAGGYSLGQARFGNPWTMICARSPGGGKIAYVSQPSGSNAGEASLHWFDLQNVNQDHLVSEDLAVDDFAFSYSGDRLAFFGRQAGQARGAVYIYDLQNNTLQRLLDRNSANSLVWSPDGRYVAMTSDPSMLGNQDALVVDVQDGRVVAHDRYNWRGDFSLDPLSPDWPTFTWLTPRGTPVKFPVSVGGMDACVSPPD